MERKSIEDLFAERKVKAQSLEGHTINHRAESDQGMGFLTIKSNVQVASDAEGTINDAVDVAITFQESFREGLLPKNYKAVLTELLNNMEELFVEGISTLEE
jgi:translation elongation factor EF-1beta